MGFDVGFLIGGICGLIGGWALAGAADWLAAMLEERQPVDMDDSLEQIRRIT